MPENGLDRRAVLAALAGAATLRTMPQAAAQTGAPAAAPLITRAVPSSGEALPVVGLGSWITFNVGNDPVARENSVAVMRAFFADGGRMIDSSPMYGSAQAVIGHGLRTLGEPPVFSADKVWVSPASRGPAQIEASRAAWGVPRFDLLQVHNLLSWEGHLRLLFEMKASGRVRYVGITTSEGRRHADIEAIMRAHPLDFVQVSYNIADRAAEERILPLAQERGIGVIVNRPFREGNLLRTLARRPLPGWAGELGVTTWAQAILKFIAAHPAVTCAIPATTKVAHVRENMAAARGALPDAALRQRMVADIGRA